MKVTFITSTGDNLVVDAARASFAVDHTKYTYEQNARLIKFLAENDHITPFFHNRFTFMFEKHQIGFEELTPENMKGMVWKEVDGALLVRHSFYGWIKLIREDKIQKDMAGSIGWSLYLKMPISYEAFMGKIPESKLGAKIVSRVEDPHFRDVHLLHSVPIFTARQEFKHMTGFERNERSGRYVSSDVEFHIPEVWRSRPDASIKQGSGADLDGYKNDIVRGMYAGLLENAETVYNTMLFLGVAPEMARMALPQSMMTSYAVTASVAGLARFVHQRSQTDAQQEIQYLAQQVDELMKAKYGAQWREWEQP